MTNKNREEQSKNNANKPQDVLKEHLIEAEHENETTLEWIELIIQDKFAEALDRALLDARRTIEEAFLVARQAGWREMDQLLVHSQSGTDKRKGV